MTEEVTLGQLTERMIPSDRLIIEDEAGNVFYKGYVGCMQRMKADESRRVKRFGLATYIFRKEIRRTGVRTDIVPCEEIKMESISEYRFSDLVVQIFTRVILEE